MKTKHIINTNKKPLLPKDYESWKIESHIKNGKVDLSKIELYLSEKQKTGYIEGNDLLKELEGKNVLNANVLDYLLEHPDLIPSKWKGKHVYFWGTIYRDFDGGLCVRCLVSDGKSWDWRYYWLDDNFFGSFDPAAVAGKSSSTKTSESLSSLDTLNLESRIEKLEEDMIKIRKFLII